MIRSYLYYTILFLIFFISIGTKTYLVYVLKKDDPFKLLTVSSKSKGLKALRFHVDTSNLL